MTYATSIQIRAAQRVLKPREQFLTVSIPNATDRVGQKPQKRRLGFLAGSVKFIAPDFDAPLQEMDEYMR